MLSLDAFFINLAYTFSSKYDAVHQCKPEEKNRCSSIYSILNASVCALQFTTSGDRLIAGFESGQVATVLGRFLNW